MQYNIEEDWQYEEKMDRIIRDLEALVLDAFIAVLHNLRQNNELFLQKINEKQQDDMKF